MKKSRLLTMILLAIAILVGLSASPFVDRSLAQSSTQSDRLAAPTAADITTTPPPFVTHRATADPVLYTPTQLLNAYDLQPLIDAGFDGNGQTIALVEVGNYIQSDVDSFVRRYHLPKPNIEIVRVANSNAKPLKADLEATADVEVVLAIAPKATILVYESAQLFDAFPQIVSDNRAIVASMSLGICEQEISPDRFVDLHRLMVPVSKQRLSIFVGSGDWGAFGCAQQTDITTRRQVISSIARSLSISAFASDPSVTAVGGTLLHLKGNKYSSEEVWNTFSAKGASGGGVSSYWPLPSYQQPYYLSALNSLSMRQIPDVSASADNYGLVLYGQFVRTTGTSLSTPLWAAGMLLVDQYLSSKLADPKAALIAPEMLYQLETAYTAGKVSLAPFHEITKGDNRFYLAGLNYNLATGLGTPDFYNIAQDAQALYTDLIYSIEPTDARGYVKRADGFRTQGKFDLALNDYIQAIAFNPDYAPIYNSRGTLYLDKSDPISAVSDFTTAVSLDPKYANAYKGLGEADEALHYSAQALKAYQTYLKLAGTDADPTVLLRVQILEVQLTPTATSTP